MNSPRAATVAVFFFLISFLFLSGATVRAGDYSSHDYSSHDYSAHDYSAHDGLDGPSLEQFLPRAVAKTLDVNFWAWLEYLNAAGNETSTYWIGDFSLGATQHIGDRFAITADIHFIDEDRHTWGFLEQAFGSAKLSARYGTELMVGKFNANFGIEQRNEWDRVTGTTGLLFGAEPQDLIGVMITQPIGETGIKVKPFVVNEFDGRGNFSQTPSGGFVLQYQRVKNLTLTVTNWVGPGLNFRTTSSGVVVPTGPVPYAVRPSDVFFGSSTPPVLTNATTPYVATNWRGPLFNGVVRSGTLYFLDAAATWTPDKRWTVGAEGLLGINSSARGRFGWAGLMTLVNYQLTPQWHVFGRWSFLNDAQTIITGVHERRHELSGGAGYEIYHGIELRGEYRHDFAPSGDLDSLSAHLNVSF